jgi:hypothetical protein
LGTQPSRAEAINKALELGEGDGFDVWWKVYEIHGDKTFVLEPKWNDGNQSFEISEVKMGHTDLVWDDPTKED